MSRACVAVPLLVAILAGTACGQSTFPIPTRDGSTVDFAIDWRDTSAIPGAYGWADVAVSNRGDAPQVATLELERRLDGAIRIRRRFELAPRSSATVALPAPQTDQGYYLQMRVRDGGALRHGLSSSLSGTWSALVVIDDGVVASSWRGALEVVAGAPPEPFHALRVDQLPPRWWHLSGFDLAVVDAAAEGLDGVVQGLFESWVRAGGRLVLLHPERLGDGALRDAVDPGRTVSVQVGFGEVLAIPAARERGLPGAVAQDGPLGDEMVRLLDATGWRMNRQQASPVAAAIRAPVPIPGIGRAPVGPFVVLMIVFAILIGPVNQFWSRRSGNRMRMLLTIPALGLGTAVVVLVIGLFQEGLASSGASRVLAVVDQVARRTVAWEQRTIFATLGAGELRPRPETMVECPLLLVADGPFEYVQAAVDAPITGLVPTRTPTPLTTVSFGDGRARLRFQRRADGGMDVLAGGGVEPTDDRDAVALCVVGEGAWVGSSARLEAVPQADFHAAAWRILTGLRAARDTAEADAQSDWQHRLIEAVARRGGYVARVVAAPGTDDLGLDVADSRSSAAVVGFIAPEDVVDG